jgi:hypothetical protein
VDPPDRRVSRIGQGLFKRIALSQYYMILISHFPPLKFSNFRPFFLNHLNLTFFFHSPFPS